MDSYYIADVTLKNCSHSYGPGCFVDQLCFIGLSSACGFGHIFNPAHEATAREAIRKYNTVTQTSSKGYVDMQKHFFPGDTGITVCEYPHGKLANGMQYTNLVSSGFSVLGVFVNAAVCDDDAASAINASGPTEAGELSPLLR